MSPACCATVPERRAPSQPFRVRGGGGANPCSPSLTPTPTPTPHKTPRGGAREAGPGRGVEHAGEGCRPPAHGSTADGAHDAAPPQPLEQAGIGRDESMKMNKRSSRSALRSRQRGCTAPLLTSSC